VKKTGERLVHSFTHAGIRLDIHWRMDRKAIIEYIRLSAGNIRSPARRPPSALIKLETAIRCHLDGRLDRLPAKNLDLSRLSKLQLEVLTLLREKTCRGRTISYRALAELAGRPRAARAVGTILRKNPFPLFFPCHRVVKADGSIGAFQGRKGNGLKLRLLEMEKQFRYRDKKSD